MKRVIWPTLITVGLALPACGGGGGGGGGGGIRDLDAAAGGNDGPVLVDGVTIDRTPEDATESARKPEEGPKIEEVTLDPDPPVATVEFRVEPVVDSPAPGPLDLTYEWYVNGDEVLGIWGDTLPQGKFVRGDRIEVSVLARDYNGKVDSFRLRNVVVSNSTPQVVSGVGTSGQLDGTVFKAMDPDGDPIRWTIEDAPQGVSIHPTSGKLQVNSSGVYDTGTYDVVVVATDPVGGEGRMGFRIDLGGSTQDTVELREVQDGKVISTSGMSDVELEKRTEDLLDRMENMSPEELEAYLEKTSGNPDEATGAAELPVGASPTPYGAGS